MPWCSSRRCFGVFPCGYNFLYSLYNENIICLEENTLNNEALKTNMMMSVAELDGEPNTLYITISEEPITPTDQNFYSKMARLLLMIEIILFKSEYKSNRIGMKNPMHRSRLGLE